VQRRDLRRRRVRVDQLLGLEREDREVVLRVNAQQLLRAELQELDRGRAWQWQDDLDSVLPEDVDLPVPKPAFARADGEERLYGIVGDLCDFGVYAIVTDLASSAWVRILAGRDRGVQSREHIHGQPQRDQVQGRRIDRCGCRPVCRVEDAPWWCCRIAVSARS
jgi:hypothetical protein